MRRIRAGRAALAGVFAFGYIYVGRVRMELGVLLAMLALLAGFAWTRWILEPWGIPALLVGLLVLALLRIVHPAWLARRSPEVPDRPYNRAWFYVLWVVVGSLVLEATVMRRADLFGYETFRIPSVNMTPTLQPGDFVVSDTWRYADSSPSPGDIVVYQRPGSDEDGVLFMSRVVALPGQTVEYRSGQLRLDGVPEARGPGPDLAAPVGPLTLGPGQYFLLGDHRDRSLDSRHFGPVDRDRIRGRVEAVWYPMSDRIQYPPRP